MTPRPLRTRPWLVALALMLPALAAQAQGGAAPGCDPSRQSCAPQASAPSSTLALPGSAASPVAGGACRPGDAGATCGGAGPASQGNSSGTNNGAGNPINVINGNKYQIEVDLAALPGELGLELVRHYNSANARVIGALGAGWRLSYETELYVIGQSIQVLQADGTRLIFAIDAANPSHCTGADPAAGHIEIGQRRSARGQRQRHYIWHWTHGPDAGRKLHFDAAGKLEQIVAASGAALTIQRGPAGELLQVTDPQGRSLRFNWASKSDVARARAQRSGGYFAGIQSIDTPLGRFIYRHGSAAQEGTPGAGDAARERAQAANLTEVAIPTHVQASQGAHPWANRASSSSSVRRLYHYEDARWPQMLTGISVQGAGSDGQQIDQRLATYGYDARGRAILSVRGPADASAPGLEQVSLQYLEPALPTRAGRTLLTNSLGEQTLYTHRIIGGEYRLLEARGAGCAQCGPVNMRYHYDALGRMNGWQRLTPTRIEAGREPPPAQVVASHRLTLDAQGNTVASDAAGTPEQAEYGDARWPDKPTLLTRASVVAGRQHQIELTYNEAGQITTLSERGWSPVNAKGEQEPTPIERATHYRYTRINGRSVLTEVDGPLANGPRGDPSDSDITRYAWDERGSFVTQVTSPGGFQSSLTHDRAGRLVKVRNDAGFATHWAWDARSQLIHLASSGPGWSQPQVQSHRYDALVRLTESARGARPTDAAAVDDGELGALLEAAGPYTAQQARGYDAAGRLAWQASALGLLQTRTHDSEGRPIESGRHSSAMAQVERWQYGPHGQIAAWSDAAGRYARIEFDAAGRPSAYRDSTGRRVALAPARPGQRAPGATSTPEAAPPGAAQILQDDFGRTVASRGGQHGRQLLVWNEADQLVAMQDALGQRAAYRHDAAGRIAEQRITPADGTPAQVTRWHYRGRLLATIEHPTQSEHYRYDARGLIASRSVTIAASAGQRAITATTRYRHDAQGRLAASSLPDGTWLHYERGGQGQVIALVRSPVQRRWLRKLAREQVIARDFQRDLVGLKGYSAGNGIQSQWQRDRHGTLARIVHRRRAASARLLHAALTPATQRALDRMLGIAHAHAQAAPRTGAADAPADPQHPAPPGALGLPAERGAFFDERYLWSSGGLLLHSQRPHGASGGTEARNWAYDASGQLIAGVQTRSRAAGAIPVADDAQETPATQVWRYAYRGQRRVLAQEAASQGETRAGTVRTAWDAQGRPLPDAASGSDAIQHPSATYDANGQPTRLGQRHYRWDALGRLAAIGDGRQPIAQYRYDHRGLRIAKQARGVRTHYLYGTGRELVAELDGQGRLQRQYVYLADLLLAAIDTPAGELAAPPAGDAASPASQQPSLWSELAALAASHLGSNGAIAHIHANHLGAPEAVSDSAGRLIWQASYAPFGMASIRSDQAPGPTKVSDRKGSAGYVLNIRLPGQYFDEESGLHYNRQRYYDPAQGAYLSPDPLGHPDGPNAYAYVANNPLGSVDPDGLILFAFDGTGNDESDPNAFSNVVRFQRLYTDEGGFKYVTGVGTDHAGRDSYGDIISDDFDQGPVPDRGGNYSGPARIERMLLYFVDAAEAFADDDAPMNIDIVGFSRGAAQARDFANRLAREASKHGGDIVRYQKHNPDGSPRIENGEAVYGCQRVNFRFMGLFDTVLSTNFSGHAYSLGIPQQFSHVAHAVALNEYRSAPFGDGVWGYLNNAPLWTATRIHLPERGHEGGFRLESIGASSVATGRVRIELGFIGSHSDIGGGYADGGTLPDVALAWMIRQAGNAGVGMGTAPINMNGTAVLHDQSNVIRFGNPDHAQTVRGRFRIRTGSTFTWYAVEDREVRGAVDGRTQRAMRFGPPLQVGGNIRITSMINADTHRFIAYDDRGVDPDKNPVAQSTRPSSEIPVLQGRAGTADEPCSPSNPGRCNRTGIVNMLEYTRWLLDNGYEL